VRINSLIFDLLLFFSNLQLENVSSRKFAGIIIYCMVSLSCSHAIQFRYIAIQNHALAANDDDFILNITESYDGLHSLYAFLSSFFYYLPKFRLAEIYTNVFQLLKVLWQKFPAKIGKKIIIPTKFCFAITGFLV
jgi:hypothetical protein